MKRCTNCSGDAHLRANEINPLILEWHCKDCHETKTHRLLYPPHTPVPAREPEEIAGVITWVG